MTVSFLFEDRFIFVSFFCFRYSNLGEVSKPLSFVNGKLQIEYENGGLCPVANISTPHIKTTITFMCDYKATVCQLGIITIYICMYRLCTSIYSKLLIDNIN